MDSTHVEDRQLTIFIVYSNIARTCKNTDKLLETDNEMEDITITFVKQIKLTPMVPYNLVSNQLYNLPLSNSKSSNLVLMIWIIASACKNG